MCKAGQVSQAEAARRCGVSWISTILHSTTEPTLGRPLSSQYRSSTNSHIFLKAIAVSIFRNKCPCGTISSKLTNDNCPLFLRFLPAFLLPYTITLHSFPRYEKKGHLPMTFFDRLKRRAADVYSATHPFVVYLLFCLFRRRRPVLEAAGQTALRLRTPPFWQYSPSAH